ncbi:SusC/RagA family TonB-linked outer membrane protein [Mucilaginibacter agri]|uniref:SusC/RagA family TonB-linked outer membrane protein n=1 Tax=Mucilaginibacter agri TaxID=2695265 RepID=A0A966DTI3_9SPHI|nr:TonB-dependent receptor [Mucilaginibacter agri]NCD71288.1 SusC/RagA family TonB-linked outer membrane protein [Mucilaginibacter agri]
MFKSLLLKVRVLCLLLCCILSSLAVTAQTKITGKVIGSDDKQPVVGAAIRIKGTTIGTVTDVNGNFTLSATSGQVLVVTYVGYTTQEVKVTGAPNYPITLVVGNNSLNEVVVTGYTSQRKKDIAGAVATVDVTAAKQLPTASSDQLLQGQAAGVTVVSQGGPGEASSVTVRGISNFGNNAPLYVIDGVQTNSMNDLNPNDIESISVLKDAGAAAIYGIAGGNGVVVITTKKGKQGKSTISYDGYIGTQRPLGGNPFNLLNGTGYAQLVKQVDPTNALLQANGQFYDYGYQGPSSKGYANEGAAAVNPNLYKFDAQNPGNDYLIQKFNKAGTDWFHEVYKPAFQQSHTVTAQGANDKNAYYFSLGYLDQKGTLIDTYYKRYQARVNTVFNVKNHVRVGENLQAYVTQRPGNIGDNNNEGNSTSYIYRIQPQIPVYDIGGNYGGTYAGTAQLGNANNPVARQDRTKNNVSKSFNVQGSAYLEADFLKYFTAKTMIAGGTSTYYYRNIATNTYESGENHAVANSTGEGSGYFTNYNWSNTINYKQIIGKHNINAIVGYEQKDNMNRIMSGSGNSLFSTDPYYASLTAATANKVVDSGVSFQPTSTQSVFARLDYIFNDKYILGATVRRDGFSAFADGRKWGTFPAVNLAWRISQEDFLKGVSWLNDLKIRGSYGEAGNNANTPGSNNLTLFGAAPSKSYYAIDGSINSSQQGFYNTQLGNTKTTWETDKISDGGFDATILNNKFDISFDYFVKKSTNLLVNVTLPATVGGGAAPYVNNGTVTNKGFEAALTYHGRAGSDFTYNLTGNFSAYKNKITALEASFDQQGSRIGTLVRQQLGQPIGAFFGYKQIGYFRDAADVAASPTQTDAAPGRFKFADIDGDGKITDKDRTNIGNPSPDFTYGLNVMLNYKHFDFTAVFYGSQGNKDYNYIKYWTNFYSTLTGNKSNDLLNNAWSPTNLTPKTPKAELTSSFSTDQQSNSYYVENGSFFKAKTMQLGYTFGANQLKRVGVDKLNIYIQATNLFTVTKYTGLDPEIQPSTSVAGGATPNAGIDYGNYPNNQRLFLLGARLTF